MTPAPFARSPFNPNEDARCRRRRFQVGHGLCAVAASVCLAACGGGGSDDEGGPVELTTAQRAAAATQTAQSEANACSPIRPFYWEVGDRTGRLASGSLSVASDPTTYDVDSVMAIASASKWLYGAYVAQVRQGALTDSDVQFLTFRSGYTSFSTCLPTQSVDECVAYRRNGELTPSHEGLFSYGGAHMEKHASLNRLGNLRNASLAAEVRSQLGSDVVLGYSQPQLAGGVYTTPGDYARFLRKLLDGSLKLGALLGQHAVCTNPATCAQAINAPTPANESLHYAIGHWVEDDPLVGDGAFNSAGAFGFYPWIDASKTWYGTVARKQVPTGDTALDQSLGEGVRSMQCGRLIRKAWTTGVPG